MFYKQLCPKCGRPIARGKGVHDGRKWYHRDCLTCAHGVPMHLDTCVRCNSDDLKVLA